MFEKARCNIQNLAKIDKSILNNIDEHIRVEADRLLEVYMTS